MTVYLLVCTSAPEDEDGNFLAAWMRAIKGDAAHVELVFFRDRMCMTYWLTGNSVYARYGARDVSGLEEKFQLHWLELPGISSERAGEIETLCATMHQTNARKMSAAMMLLSAFPIRSAFLLPYVLAVVDPRYAREVKVFRDDSDDPDSSFCAAACAEVLGIPSFRQCNPCDLIAECIDRFGGRFVAEGPLPESAPVQVDGGIRDSARIIRSEYLV